MTSEFIIFLSKKHVREFILILIFSLFRFHNFNKVTSSLLYAFTINEGPISSIKFHPCGTPNYERIGTLAISTAHKDVLVYSLPYLNNSKVVIPEPLFICRLANEEIFFQDNFLLQVTRVNWHYEKDFNNILIAGYVNGYVSLFKLNEKGDSVGTKLPILAIQAHHGPVAAIDTKICENGQFLLLTASLGREIKIFSIIKSRYEETATFQPSSRIFCAQFLLNWPAIVMGNDSGYNPGNIILRQPFEFGNKNIALMGVGSSIVTLDTCSWTSKILFATDGGDVLGCYNKQLMLNPKNSKDRWSYFQNSVFSFTDYRHINKVSDEIGIVFNDIKVKRKRERKRILKNILIMKLIFSFSFHSQTNFTKKPKKFRDVPAELTNQLQINQVCFNRNEKSHHFYALAYETGFVRIKHLKNFTK